MATINQQTDKDKMLVIVITGPRHFETRSWCCNNEIESLSMLKWLADNGISASRMSQRVWEQMNGS